MSFFTAYVFTVVFAVVFVMHIIQRIIFASQEHFHSAISELLNISISKEPAGLVHIFRYAGHPKV